MSFEIFMQEYGYHLLFVIVGFVISFILSKITGDKKYIKEMYEIMVTKYRTEHYKVDENISSPGQSFDNARFKPVYRLNKSTGLLEKTDDVVDVQEMLDSCKNIALESVMAKFMPSIETVQDTTAFNKLNDDLDSMMYATSLTEKYREKYKIGDDVTDDQVISFLIKKAKELQVKLNAQEKKGDVKDETNG